MVINHLSKSWDDPPSTTWKTFDSGCQDLMVSLRLSVESQQMASFCWDPKAAQPLNNTVDGSEIRKNPVEVGS